MNEPSVSVAPRILPCAVLALAPVLALALAAPASAALPAPQDEPGRVVLLGFDGADARTIRELVEADPGSYPNFRRLQEEGTFAPLEVVVPPESPVSWAALNTGQNPAKTGVPGFVRRALNDGRPQPALGHMVTDAELEVAELENLPLPAWSGTKLALLAGAAAFVLVLLVVLLLSGGRLLVALVVALVAGAGAAWAGSWSRGFLPETVPATLNPNKARNVWDFAAEAGVPSVVLCAAQAFSMPAPEGARVLAGLGVPDARGGIGDWFIYTTDPEEFNREGRSTTTAGTVFRVEEYDGRIETKIYGPKNFWEIERLERELEEIREESRRPDISLERSRELSRREQEIGDVLKRGSLEAHTTVDMVIERSEDGSGARITIGDQEQVVELDEWSDFYELEFDLNWLLDVDALTRVRLISLDPHVEVFVNVLDLDPREPPAWQPLSYPHDFSAELAHECGLYETYGWPTATMPVKDGEVLPELLMEDVQFTMQWRERLTQKMLEEDDWRFLMSVFSTTDRVQHMMYQFYDSEHPLHDPEAAAREMEFFGETITLADAVPAIYRQMDRVIGDVLDRIRPEDTLLVCSDHGFQSFRHQVNLNNWLIEEGYLALKPGATKGSAIALLFVDWSKTKAYSLGMGFIYLNLEGREANGIVKPEEADALIAEIREKLLAAQDPERKTSFCEEVYVTDRIHEGPYLDLESELIAGFAPPYRISWSTTSGGLHMVKNSLGEDVPGPVITDNDSPWSGGHVSMALSAVPGVFFSNRRFDLPEGGAKALQIAPTVLQLLGVPVPAEMDLEPLPVP